MHIIRCVYPFNCRGILLNTNDKLNFKQKEMLEQVQLIIFLWQENLYLKHNNIMSILDTYDSSKL